MNIQFDLFLYILDKHAKGMKLIAKQRKNIYRSRILSLFLFSYGELPIRICMSDLHEEATYIFQQIICMPWSELWNEFYKWHFEHFNLIQNQHDLYDKSVGEAELRHWTDLSKHKCHPLYAALTHSHCYIDSVAMLWTER